MLRFVFFFILTTGSLDMDGKALLHLSFIIILGTKLNIFEAPHCSSSTQLLIFVITSVSGP